MILISVSYEIYKKMGNVCSADVGPVFPTFKLYIENAKNLVGERDKVVETYVKISFWDMRSLPKWKIFLIRNKTITISTSFAPSYQKNHKLYPSVVLSDTASQPREQDHE